MYNLRLGPRVPNWQAASKMFSSLTESADLVKVLTAAQVNYSFHILAKRGARRQRLPNVYPHVIFHSRNRPRTIISRYYARVLVEGLGSEAKSSLQAQQLVQSFLHRVSFTEQQKGNLHDSHTHILKNDHSQIIHPSTLTEHQTTQY